MDIIGQGTYLSVALFFIASIRLELSAQFKGSARIIGEDSVQWYYNANGYLTSAECAVYYRLAKMDSVYFAFNGRYQDFTIDGDLLLEGFFVLNKPHGPYRSYHKKGQLMASGQYRKGRKTGKWFYWYKTGKLRKTVSYAHVTPRVIDLYNKNGRALVTEGNGSFKDDLIFPDHVLIGELVNGRPHGQWIMRNQMNGTIIAKEYFEKGTFMAGENIALNPFTNYMYSEKSYFKVDTTYQLMAEKFTQTQVCPPKWLSSWSQVDAMFPLDDLSIQYPFALWLAERLAPPDEIGYLLLSFTINKAGQLVDYQVSGNFITETFRNEVAAVLGTSPKWLPALINDQPVTSTHVAIVQVFGKDRVHVMFNK